jgi:hypothetical protein
MQFRFSDFLLSPMVEEDLVTFVHLGNPDSFLRFVTERGASIELLNAQMDEVYSPVFIQQLRPVRCGPVQSGPVRPGSILDGIACDAAFGRDSTPKFLHAEFEEAEPGAFPSGTRRFRQWSFVFWCSSPFCQPRVVAPLVSSSLGAISGISALGFFFCFVDCLPHPRGCCSFELPGVGIFLFGF